MSQGISIIIACYNSEKVISTTLEHLQNQKKYEGINWEVIVIDNNSTDNTDTATVTTRKETQRTIPRKDRVEIKKLVEPKVVAEEISNIEVRRLDDNIELDAGVYKAKQEIVIRDVTESAGGVKPFSPSN